MKIFVASPYAGMYSHIQQMNISYAQQCCKAIVEAGHNPFAPHLHDTQFLNDKVPRERALGLSNGREFMKGCDVVIAFIGRGMSDGMKGDLAWAKKIGKPVYQTEIEGLKETLRQINRERRKAEEKDATDT